MRIHPYGYEDLFYSLLQCPTCGGSLKRLPEHLHCAPCKHDVPLLHGAFPDFVGNRDKLSATEQIELQNLDAQVEKIHRDNWRDAYNIERVEEIARMLPPSALVLDIGAADGQIATFLRETHGHKVISLEKTPLWLDVHGSAGVPFVFSDGYRLPFADDVFDAVLMGEILEHLYDPRQAVLSALRVLRKGGTFIATVPNFGFIGKRLRYARGMFGEDPDRPLTHEHIRFFTQKAIRDLVNDVGLRDARITPLWQKGLNLTRHTRSENLMRSFYRRTKMLPDLFAACFVFKGIKP